MKISYNWLKSYIENVPEAEKLADVFTYNICEVESVTKVGDDSIFDLKILPDRAHDLLSHQGVAREVSSVLGLKFLDPTHLYKIPSKKENTDSQITHAELASMYKLDVKIETTNCRRYMTRIVRGVKVGPSPLWMVNYLQAIGQRSINNIVDATNIVMYDIGQPVHAFDLKIVGTNLLEEKKVVITSAKDGDELKLVGREGIVAKLKETDTVITDGIKNLALAGIKGGADSGVSDSTCDILLEVANFDPVAVRKTAKRLSIFTDSAKRFENEIHPSLCETAIVELSALIFENNPDASFGEVVDVYPDRDIWENKKNISFTTSFINKKLGSNISKEEIENILKNHQYKYSVLESDNSSDSQNKSPDHETSVDSKAVFTVEIPLLRFDLENPIDMVEEIGKSIGYDKVEQALPKVDFSKNINTNYERMLKVRDLFVSQGYREVMTYTFSNTGETQVLASASDKKFLRTNLLDGLKKAYELNKNNMALLGLSEIKIFEIGTVFKNDTEVLNIAYINKKESNELPLSDFLNSDVDIADDLFAILENFFGIKISDVKEENYAEENILENDKTKKENNFNINAKFKNWSPYPYIVRDIATWVPVETDKSVLVDIYKENGGEFLLGEPMIFDTFTKNERTSYAYRLIFQSYDKTLTDEEINPIMENIQAKIKELGFEIR